MSSKTNYFQTKFSPPGGKYLFLYWISVVIFFKTFINFSSIFLSYPVKAIVASELSPTDSIMQVCDFTYKLHAYSYHNPALAPIDHD